jgi:hypothetical protein
MAQDWWIHAGRMGEVTCLRIIRYAHGRYALIGLPPSADVQNVNAK